MAHAVDIIGDHINTLRKEKAYLVARYEVTSDRSYLKKSNKILKEIEGLEKLIKEK